MSSPVEDFGPTPENIQAAQRRVRELVTAALAGITDEDYKLLNTSIDDVIRELRSDSAEKTVVGLKRVLMELSARLANMIHETAVDNDLDPRELWQAMVRVELEQDNKSE